MKKQKFDLTLDEVKLNLKLQGISVKPSYCHEDYLYTSFTLPYPLKDKLDRMNKNLGLSRSKFLQTLIKNIDEESFKKLVLGE